MYTYKLDENQHQNEKSARKNKQILEILITTSSTYHIKQYRNLTHLLKKFNKIFKNIFLFNC